MAYFHCFSYQLEVPLLSARQAKMNGAGYQIRPDSTTTERSRAFIEESDVKSGQEFMYRDELLNRIYKFMGVVETTLQDLQIQGLMIKKALRRYCYLLRRLGSVEGRLLSRLSFNSTNIVELLL